MEKVLEIRTYLLKFYSKNSRYVDSAFRFVVALSTFLFISNQIGFMDILSSVAVTIGMALMCMFLPFSMTAVIAAIMVVLQMFTLAPGVGVVAGLMMFVMFVFYFRYAPKNGIVLLLLPICFSLNIPVLIPIVFGMIGGPICVIPIMFGTVIYYMITYVKSYATLIESVAEGGIMEQIPSFTQQLFGDREMWMVVIAFSVCLLTVYCIKRLSIDYAWEIAAITGAMVNLLVMTLGYVLLDVELDIILIPSSIVAVLIAIVVKIFVFSVNYARSEYLQFEDDEYYYYVKAIPKVSMPVREKTVKKINTRKEGTSKESVQKKKRIEEISMVEDIDVEESEIQRIIEEELKKR